MVVFVAAATGAGLVIVLKMRQTYEDCLETNGFNLGPKVLHHIWALNLTDDFENMGEALFVIRFILLELLRILVDCVVGQMHHKVFLVVAGGVVFGGKTSETIFIDETLQVWNHLSDQNINAKVKLFAVDKVGETLILLYYLGNVSWNLPDLSCDEDTLALAGVDWLNNESHGLLLVLYKVHEVI